MEKIIKKITEIRRQLHKQPELGYKEFKTTELIRETLAEQGIQFTPFKNLKTGGFAEIGSGKTLLYRADIDALPILEDPKNKYISENPGVMHACGHDFHTAIGLGLLLYFQENPGELKGKLRVIFQPAEETTPSGAAFVIKEDIWENAVAILAIHVNSEDSTGEVSLSKNAANGSNTSVNIVLKGPGGHTSRPDQSVDLILYGCEYVTQLHTYIKNKTDPRDTVSFAFGKISGGHAKNAIPQSIELLGTLRTHSNKVLLQSQNLIDMFSKNFCKLHNLKIDIDFPSSCPVAINDSHLVNQFLNYFSENFENKLTILQKPSMGADDFAFYLHKVPGLYLRIGGAGKGAAHTGEFEVNEKIFEPALNTIKGYITYFFEKS